MICTLIRCKQLYLYGLKNEAKRVMSLVLFGAGKANAILLFKPLNTLSAMQLLSKIPLPEENDGQGPRRKPYLKRLNLRRQAHVSSHKTRFAGRRLGRTTMLMIDARTFSAL
jgi:hypothetical protein